MFCSWITHHVPNWQDCIVVSPDEGGAKRSVMIANDLGLEFAMVVRLGSAIWETDQFRDCIADKPRAIAKLGPADA